MQTPPLISEKENWYSQQWKARFTLIIAGPAKNVKRALHRNLLDKKGSFVI
jgi:hypothetical protein